MKIIKRELGEIVFELKEIHEWIQHMIDDCDHSSMASASDEFLESIKKLHAIVSKIDERLT